MYILWVLTNVWFTITVPCGSHFTTLISMFKYYSNSSNCFTILWYYCYSFSSCSCFFFFPSVLVWLTWDFRSFSFYQFGSVQLLSRVWLFVTPWTAAYQASLSITNSWSLLKLMSIASVMPSNHLILCHPLLLQPSIFPSFRVFSNKFDSSHQVAKVLEFQLQHQSFQWTTKTDFL